MQIEHYGFVHNIYYCVVQIERYGFVHSIHYCVVQIERYGFVHNIQYWFPLLSTVALCIVYIIALYS